MQLYFVIQIHIHSNSLQDYAGNFDCRARGDSKELWHRIYKTNFSCANQHPFSERFRHLNSYINHPNISFYLRSPELICSCTV